MCALKPGGTSANYPAWSPRGGSVVFSAGSRGVMGLMDSLGISNAGLARVREEADGWGSPEWLVAQGDAGGTGENLFYPAYSPDGRWIVFNRAESDAAVGASPAGSELWVVSDERGSAIRLTAANGESSIANSWPKWAPESADGTLWIAFTSSRPYGRLGQGQPQIWIAGIDPERAMRGEDPSSAAFWMPFQSLADPNHVAYWAEFTKE